MDFGISDGAYAFTVGLGKHVKSSKGKDRQKGVDILMAIDALTKAYQNQYETTMFLLEDADFKPLVDAVKNTGKKTIRVFMKETCPIDLASSFNTRIWIRKQVLRLYYLIRKVKDKSQKRERAYVGHGIHAKNERGYLAPDVF